MLTGSATELRHAVRSLLRTPLFTIGVVGILGLGIATTTITYSVVSGVLLRPLPFREPDRIAMIWGNVTQAQLGFAEQPLGGRHFELIRKETHTFSSVTAMLPRLYNLGESTSAERVDGVQVTGDFFRTMGVEPRIGRGFRREDEDPGSDHIAVLSDALWRRRFNADRMIVGRVVTLDNEPYTVIGIAPPGFAFPRGAEMPTQFQFPEQAELWTPLKPPLRGPSELAAIGRLRSDVPLTEAQSDFDRITRLMEEEIPQGKGWFGTMIVPLQQQIVGNVTRMLWSLLGAVGLLLVIATVNAAQLLVARLRARASDIAIRAALGASRPRLARELLIESFVLTSFAGIVGVAVAWLGVMTLRAYGSNRIPRLSEIAMDGRIVAAAIGVTLFAGVLFGVVPALASTKVSLSTLIRRGGRGAGKGMPEKARRLMIAGEVALSVVLLVGAGLLVQSLKRQLASDTGFVPTHAITFEVSLPPIRYTEKQFRTYKEHPEAVPFFTAALERIRAIPGVKAAGIGKPLPLSGAQEWSVFWMEDKLPAGADQAHAPGADYTVASPGMFDALGVQLVSGRDFSAQDREDSQPVVIVNQSMAKWLWPNQNAVGKRIKLGGAPDAPAPWMTVIAVARDLRRYSLTESPRPEMIVPYTQKPYPTFSPMQFVVRASGDPTHLVTAMRTAIAQVDPNIPIAKVRTIDDLVGDASATARFAAQFMTAFGAAGLVLALLGLYAVIAYSVFHRRREIAVRRALGATTRGVVSLVIREGMGLAGTGIVVGLVLAAMLVRTLQSLLFGVSMLDLSTLAGAIGLLVVGTAAACVLPAARAASLEPRVALEEN